MASVGGSPSPESTVTLLLASSGRLRSSLRPEPFPSIKYKDRLYDSASDALDDYIADFQSSRSSVGHLVLSEDRNAPHPSRPGFRNRDVLKESLSDRELDFLKLPVTFKHRESDLVSVTTDDLLLLPVDGSLPVTRTSARLARSGSRTPAARTNSQTRRAQSGSSRTLNTSLNSSSALRTLCVEDLVMEASRCGRPSDWTTTRTDKHRSRSSDHIPRWMTSHKSEMDFSGLTSLPDLKYPAWLDDCAAPQTKTVPPWSIRLEQNERSNNRARQCEEPFKEDKIGCLIQRVEEVLKSPSLGFPSSVKEHHGSPGNTEELLDAERSWDNPPVMFKSPVPMSNFIDLKESPKDTREKSSGSFSSGYSSRKHPGPVEALKQMLFSLQAVEHKVTQQKDELIVSTETVPNLLTQNDKDSKKFPPPDVEGSDPDPGGQSLTRALHHLGRLKSLVEEINQRKGRETQQGAL